MRTSDEPQLPPDTSPTFESFKISLETLARTANYRKISKQEFFESGLRLVRTWDYFSVEIDGYYYHPASSSGSLQLIASTSNRAWQFKVADEPTRFSTIRLGVSSKALHDGRIADASKFGWEPLWFHTRRPPFSEITMVFFEQSEIFGGHFSDFRPISMTWLNERYLIILSCEQNKPEKVMRGIFDTSRQIAIYLEKSISGVVYYKQFAKKASFFRTAHSDPETVVYLSSEKSNTSS